MAFTAPSIVRSALLLALCCSSVSCSSTDDADSGSPDPKPAETDPLFPASNAQADVAAFLAAELYREEPWIADPSSRPPEPFSGTVHYQVRVFFNPKVIESLANPPPSDSDEALIRPGSMVVKEIYDANEEVIGKATVLKAEGTSHWTYFCYGSGSRCGDTGVFTLEDPIYGVGSEVGCSHCHGDYVISPLPNSAP